MDYSKIEFGLERQRSCLLRRPGPPRRPYGSHAIVCTVLGLVMSFLITATGCSREKQQVEDVALQFIDGVKNGDAQTFEKIMDWERWYSVQTAATGQAKRGSSDKGLPAGGKNRRNIKGSIGDAIDSEDFKNQKEMLLAVLSGDPVLKLRYLTAEHDVKHVTVDGPEAIVQVNQSDRATGDRRLLTFWLHKDPDSVWRIYKFLSEDLKRT